MILLVETNFVLELAYGQEEHASCRALVDLAERNDALSLALPAYCVGEAHERQIRRQREREALQRRLAAELGELSRSQTHAGRLEEVGEVTALLAESAEEERRSLESVLGELYEGATLIPSTSLSPGRPTASNGAVASAPRTRWSTLRSSHTCAAREAKGSPLGARAAS